MSIAKSDVVHLICGLSSAAESLVNVPSSVNASRALLKAVEKLANEISNSPVSDTLIVAGKTKKTSK